MVASKSLWHLWFTVYQIDDVATSKVAKILRCDNSKIKTAFCGIIENQCDQDKTYSVFETLQHGGKQKSVAFMVYYLLI